MNKNFEDAYVAEVQQNIPDLWNRIECSLPEKVSVQKKKKKTYTWIKWASLAAACLLVLMIAPAVIGIGLVGTVMNEETAAADTAAPEIYYENAMMDMECAEEEKGYEESVAENETDCAVQAAPVTDESYEPMVEELYAEVVEVNKQEEYYEAVLAFSDINRLIADSVFEDDSFYTEGHLIVRVYPGKGEVPVAGEKYSVDIYSGTDSGLSIVLPCIAELEYIAKEQY